MKWMTLILILMALATAVYEYRPQCQATNMKVGSNGEVTPLYACTNLGWLKYTSDL